MLSRLASRIGSMLKDFVRDVLDRSAKPRDSSNWIPELWAVVGVLGAGAVSYAESVQKVAAIFLGSASSLLPALLALTGTLWCIWIIDAKQVRASQPVLVGGSVFEYAYRQPVRQIAKVGLLALLVLLPIKISAAVDDFIPLPLTFYGFLLDSRTGQRIEAATVRVVNVNGVDVTRDGTWESDKYGFYEVRTLQPVTRDGHLSIKMADCPEIRTLPIRKADQCSTCPSSPFVSTKLKPMFRHVFSCGGKQ
jgi:hypothetical protein